LKDLGITDEEIEHLRCVADNVSEPLNKLVQFYLYPKTFSQKLKRAWKVQKIFFKTVRIIHRRGAPVCAPLQEKSDTMRMHTWKK